MGGSLGVLVPRKYLVRDAISTKHTYNHYGQSSVGGILYLFTFWAFWAFLDLVNRNSAALFRSLMRSCMRSLCLHSRHTNILHTRHNRSTASPPPSSHKETRHKHHGGQAAQAATARDAKRPNCQGQGPQGKAPQALHLNLADGRVRRATCVPRAASRLCTAGTRCARTHARTHARRTRPHSLLHAHN